MSFPMPGGGGHEYAGAVAGVRRAGLAGGETVVVLGLWHEPVPIDSWDAVLKDARLLFSFTYGLTGKRHDFEVCLSWMESGQVPAQELVTHVRPLADIAEAFELAADKSQGVIKVIVTP